MAKCMGLHRPSPSSGSPATVVGLYWRRAGTTEQNSMQRFDRIWFPALFLT